MLSGRILPIHFPPAPDELLSSWYVRLAHANRLKVETFCTVLWGSEHQLWNRDIDRLSPEWLVKDLADRTGTPFEIAWDSTLKSYEGKVFIALRPTSISPWILPVQVYHRKHKWPGIQYCPECLKDDEEPYFRKRWRLAFYTTCNRHGILVHDHCPVCGEPVMFHRRELGKGAQLDIQPLSLCYKCNYDLRRTEAKQPEPYELSASVIASDATGWLGNVLPPFKDVGFYTVLHQICKLLFSERWGKELRSFVISQLGLNFSVMTPNEEATQKRAFFEHHSIAERHYTLHLAYWLLADPATRLGVALESKAVRFNRLYRDFQLIPSWYFDVISGLSHRGITKFHEY